MARILIVDDSDCSAFQSYLELDGHEVSHISNPKYALEQYRAGHVDIVITDYDMPEMDGPDLVRRIRSIDDAPIFFGMTGNLTRSREREMLEAGVYQVMAKPFRLCDFCSLIEMCAREPEIFRIGYEKIYRGTS